MADLVRPEFSIFESAGHASPLIDIGIGFLSGRSAARLYHWRGISLTAKSILGSIMVAHSKKFRWNSWRRGGLKVNPDMEAPWLRVERRSAGSGLPDTAHE